LDGDIESFGVKLAAPPQLVARFDNFLRWEPIPPKSAAELARVSARLCRLLRDEVTEQLAEKSPALTALAAFVISLAPRAADNALLEAVRVGNAAEATRLVQSGADVNAAGTPALSG
jgi:hypothetical protein